MLKKIKIRKILIGYGVALLAISVIIAIVFTIGMKDINGDVHDLYDIAVETHANVATVQTNLMKIGNNYMLIFVEKDFSTVATRLEEINQWTTEDKELLTAYFDTGIDGEALAAYNALQDALVPYRETRGLMDERLLANDYNAAVDYYDDFEAYREDVDSKIAALCEITGSRGEGVVSESDSAIDFSRAKFPLVLNCI